MSVKAETSGETLGKAWRRLEDHRLLTGRGRYGDDLSLPGEAHALVLRSPLAHAAIPRLDCAAARALPGVLAVYTVAELDARGIGDIPCNTPLRGRGGSRTVIPPRPALARGRVRHVGDPVAFVVAESLAVARDALELIEVDYEELPAVVGGAAALAPDSPRIWEQAPDNLALDWDFGDAAATAAAFERAAHVTRLTLVNNRVVVGSLEPRGALGLYDAESERFTLHTGSQGVHKLRVQLAGQIFKLPEEHIRVVSGDVGGGFGMKNFLYPEHILVLVAARDLGRPVRWTSERSEAFVSDTQGRDQLNEAELALDAEGRMLAVRVSTVADMGAYLSTVAPIVPTTCCVKMMTGLYAIPALYGRVRCVFTNSVPVDAYRGAGRPEAAYVIERLVDRAARELGLPPEELRRRNFIPSAEMPYKTPGGLVFDSGDFAALLTRALARADWPAALARRDAARAEGRLVGLGLSCYAEECGAFGEESARLSLERDGRLRAELGTQSNGQGHETVYCQILAEELGLPPETIRVEQGDSERLAQGGGTGGSRSLIMGGTALSSASGRFLARLRTIAARLLESDEDGILYQEGRFLREGTNRSLSLAEIAAALEQEDEALPDETARIQAPPQTYPNGCHICEVEVDPETGTVTILRYLALDDFGRLGNPLLAAGQVHGGVAQGLGQALFERSYYEAESGQLLTGSFLDYTLPRADDLPPLEAALVEDYPCRTNPRGFKGAGEAGSIAASPAVMNALVDALSPRGITHIDMPATPERVWRALQARGQGD